MPSPRTTGNAAALGLLALGLAIALASLFGPLARAQASLPPSVHVVPGSQRKVIDLAASADGQTVAYTLAENCGYKLCARYPTFVARRGQLLRVDESRYPPLTEGAVSLAGDGRIVAYPASHDGREGTVLYDLARRRARFVPGFVFMGSSPSERTISDTGRYLLGTRAHHASSPGVFDVQTGKFVPLPRPPKPFIAIPQFLSGDGHTVLLTDSTYLKGGIAQTVRFSVTTGDSKVLTHSNPFTRGSSAFGLGLSANGEIALVAGQPAGSTNSAQATLFDGGADRVTPLFPDAAQFRLIPTTVSLTADGQTIAFSCADSLYLYQPASGRVSRVLANFEHGKAPVRGYITSSGNAIVFGRESSDTTDFRGGLFVAATAGGTSLGTSFPAGCGS